MTMAKGAPNIIHSDKSAVKIELENFQKEEAKLVRGIFKNYECPGGGVMVVQQKYKGKIFNKWMEDGQEYEIPLWVARWLNGTDITAKALNGKIGSCAYPVHEYAVDRETGKPKAAIGKRKQRYGFQSMEFIM